MLVPEASILFSVAAGCALLLILTIAAFWWGTRPSLWDEPREEAPHER